IAHQSKVGRTRNSIHISEGCLSNRDNVAVSLEGESKSMCQDIPREWCCHPAVIPEAVINRAVRVVAYQQETRYAVGKHWIRRGNNAAGANDPRYTRGVGRNDKSARAVKGEPRSLAVDTETCNKTAIQSVEGRYAAGADQDVAIWQKNDRFAADCGGCAIQAKGRVKLAIREQARDDASGGAENCSVSSQGQPFTGWRKEESGCLDGCGAVAAEGGVWATVSIEAENLEPKITGSRRENFPVRLNGHGKRGAGVSATDQHLAAGAETRIERTIGVVTQEPRLSEVLLGPDCPGYDDLPVELEGCIALEGCSIGACVCRSDNAVVTESRVQAPGLGH